ncbi:uncharacterized protein K02A2.6-like [Liolophura sinensis]|uniref:uncharacterized protein K02A2.6-like n=1 Tax=Liolophura sinensis TaxID=3198878 RepID=UPI0031595E80
MDTYATRLRQLALTLGCEFSDQDTEIKGQLIQGCSSNRIRRRILGDPDLKLMDILNLARAMEQSERQAKRIEQSNQPIPETVFKPNYTWTAAYNPSLTNTDVYRLICVNVRQQHSNDYLNLTLSNQLVMVPTPWVSPIHVVEKPKNPSQIRICVDMRAPNEAIQRERHITPTLDDIISELNGSKIFSKLYLNAGYHQIDLHPESRSLTTFSTHMGLFRYKRLNFGVCSAAEVFQNHIRMALQGLAGVINLSDDVFLHGRDQQEHDQRLESTLQRRRALNLTQNHHKPLIPLFNKASSKPPARIERWILKLQGYSYNVTYRPGHGNPADFLSRHHVQSPDAPSCEEKMAEKHTNFLTQHAVPKALTPAEIQDATKADPLLRTVMGLVKGNKWKSAYKPNVNAKLDSATARQLQSFATVHTDLSVNSDGNILLFGSRIVIPACLQQRVCDLAHVGHQGIVKTKKLLRQKVWFPGIDKLVETTIHNCILCQAVTPENSSRGEPLKMTALPQAPWENVCADFVGPLPSGDYLLIVYDEYSRYPEVEKAFCTSARSTIPAFDKIFATHGIPSVLKTDNGPPFNSTEFHQFLDYLAMKHRRITPYWARANGDAERFIKTLQKAMRASEAEGKPWKQELYKFLRNYHATPHSSTDKPPAELLLNRPYRTTLPQLAQPVSQSDIQVTDDSAKQRSIMLIFTHRLSQPPFVLVISYYYATRKRVNLNLCSAPTRIKSPQ